VNNKIILIGYMGCGKSTIAKLLSEKVNIPVVELDKKIEEKANLSVSEIFEKRGELYFRKIENEIYNSLLESKEKMIISTGGGTPCYFDNYKTLDKFNSFYLKASVNTLFERLEKEKLKRPIIANLDNNELIEFIGKHLFERNYYYNQAKYTVVIDTKTKSEIVKEIIKLI
jgi:shikimate kinase